MYVIRYLRALVKNWFFWISLSLEIIALCTPVLFPDFALPLWLYIIIITLGYILANIKIYTDLLQRVDMLEAEEADLQIAVTPYHGFRPPEISARVDPPFRVEPVYNRSNRSSHGFGYRDDGLPGWASIWVQTTIQNIGGYASHRLEWEIDWKHTKIPELFILKEDWVRIDGVVKDIQPSVDGRRQDWSIYFKIADNYHDPQRFALQLSNERKWKIVIRYWVKRVNGRSKTSKFEVEGNFSGFCEKLAENWKTLGHQPLADLLVDEM